MQGEVMQDEDVKIKSDINYQEIGINGFEFSGDFVRTDFLPQLQWPQAAGVYEEMSKNDPTIGAILYMSKQLVRRSKWDVKGGTSPRDLEAIEFLRTCMDDMEQSWNEFIGEVLTMMVYGWSFHEVVYKIRGGNVTNPKLKSKYEDGKIGWRKFASRSQRTCYGWDINQETGEIIALKQQAAPDYRMRIIPIEKAIHFKTENDNGNPFGRSLLRNTYRPWFFKKRIEEIEGIGIERDLAGLPMLIPPIGLDIWDTKDADLIRLRGQAEKLVKSIRRDQSEGVVIPNGWELKLLSTGSQRQFDTNQILNRYDQRIAITMLADIVMLGADKVGSFALADVKKSLLSSSLETLLDCIADAINRQEVSRILALNGFTDLKENPKLVPDEVEAPNIEELTYLLDSMTKAGMDTKDPAIEAFLRKVSSLPNNTKEATEAKEEAYKIYLKNLTIVPEPIVEPKVETEVKPIEPEIEKSIDETYTLK